MTTPTTAARSVRIVNWKPMQRNSLRGFATVEFPLKVILSDVSIQTLNDSWWASPPSRRWLAATGPCCGMQTGKFATRQLLISVPGTLAAGGQRRSSKRCGLHARRYSDERSCLH